MKALQIRSLVLACLLAGVSAAQAQEVTVLTAWYGQSCAAPQQPVSH